MMAIRDLVIQSQLIPPSQRKGVLHRARLAERLRAVFDYPLTVVQAGTGHGKTTTLAAFAGTVDPLFWYTVTEPDRDPLLFLAHLLSAFNRNGYGLGDAALASLEETGGRVTPAGLTPLLNSLTTGLPDPAVLVLDDYHLVADVLEISALIERLVDYTPQNLHIVLSSRQIPLFPSGALTRWRVKDQVLCLHRSDLAFTRQEIEALFREQYGLAISDQQVQALETETEGWAIALQMIWQSLKSGAVTSVDEVLHRLPESLEGLFDYLAAEVLNRQPEALQRFLLTVSVLRHLDGPACDALLGVDGSRQALNTLLERGLFLTSSEEGNFRFQHLFHNFLYRQLAQDPERAQALHHRAAEYFAKSGQVEESIYHLLEADDFEIAAQRIEQIGDSLIELGRLDSLTGWIARLPEPVLNIHPELYLLSGNVLRLRSSFEEALRSFTTAQDLFAAGEDGLGQARALQGQAQVYLDTIRPIKADALLESALQLLDPNIHRAEIAELLEQLAENRLNLGRPDQAKAFLHQARLLRAEAKPEDRFLEARALIRTGQLVQARDLLEDSARHERANDRPQRFHRETQAVLSLLCSLMGDAPAAERAARENIITGKRLDAAFVEAVGFMRLGHPLLLTGHHPWQTERRSQVVHCYQRAIEIVHPFRVNRVMVEPLWGLCRAHGWFGNLALAQQAAEQGQEIAHQAGDEWMCNLMRVTLGAGMTVAGQVGPAETWLQDARAGFQQVNDAFGETAALLWLVINRQQQGQSEDALAVFSQVLERIDRYGYDFLLTRPTHIGLKDEQVIVPLLLAARKARQHLPVVERLLGTLGLSAIEDHPGYCLYVRTLGPFTVWRGDEKLRPQDWQREKARSLFQLLITERGRWLAREQISELLWPELDPEAAVRDFKAALNALNRALEPNRAQGATPFFVIRSDNLYRINPLAKVVLDSDDFENAGRSGSLDDLRQALSLYQNDYLLAERLPSDDWALATRERLRSLYFQFGDRLAEMLIHEGQCEAAIQVCQNLLAADRACEPAYRRLMQAYSALGNRPQMVSAFQRCRQTLREELDVEPSEETIALFDRLTG